MAGSFPIFDDESFDSNTTKIMDEAFDKCRQALNWVQRPPVLNEGLAKRIIEIAKTGERDPDRLCSLALKALGLNR
jgi:hypothetical protein